MLYLFLLEDSECFRSVLKDPSSKFVKLLYLIIVGFIFFEICFQYSNYHFMMIRYSCFDNTRILKAIVSVC